MNEDDATDQSDPGLSALAATTLAIVWVTDADGEVAASNPSWAAFTGQSFAQYRGSGWLDAVHPDDREQARATWNAGVHRGASLTLRYRLRRQDGEWRNMVAESAPVLIEGKRAEWVGFCIDDTDRQRAEAASRSSERRLRFLDQLGLATRTTVDATGVMQVTAQLLGEHLGATRTAYADVEADNDRFHIRADWSAPGVPSSVGSYSLALFGPLAVANLHRGITLVVRDVDAELGAEGGAAMFNSIGIQAIVCAGLVKNDKLVAMMAVHQDRPRDWESDEIAMVEEVVERCWAHIERVRDTAKLVEQDRRKEEFIALLSHELRNPLAPLRYASALLPHVQPGSEAARDAHARIDRQVRHLGRLIDDLLDVSRINQGLIELKTQRVELLPLLAQAVDELRPGIDARHTLECDWVKGGEPLVVIGDPVRIVQMVGNLLHNATKYTPPGGRIKLAARRDGDHVVISVADTGMGIPPEQQGGLFEMFTQLPNTAGLSQGGLGIGLAVVKRLAKLHHGDVRVVSPGAGLGTTFSINLPVVPASEQAELAQSRTAQTRPRGRRVLVVEDNEENRESLVTLLSVLGHEVDAAEDGRSGLEAASRFRPDVVLLDLGLPEIDGVEVGRRLRSDSNYDGVGLVALTGWGSAKDRQRTAEAGFDIHLTKPVDVNALEQAIVSVSERRLARRTA